jgi:hypothetical protein
MHTVLRQIRDGGRDGQRVRRDGTYSREQIDRLCICVHARIGAVMAVVWFEVVEIGGQ